ncbi:uncharacterized protein LOC142317630 [Lycorma delicatula]|uniref:uncharacterized protein LOC142317630 n=1 Tax=Lycorma delicatula TaxID=130591 RepID=UPI003F51AA23
MKELKGNREDQNVFIGHQIFKFHNGDIYVGSFKATIKNEIFKHGYGKYFCEDGTSYSGEWYEDQLVDAFIVLGDGGFYEGPLQNFKFFGNGIYKMSQIGSLYIMFVNNYPSGKIILVDQHGFHWQGMSTDKKNESILYPVNYFKINAKYTNQYKHFSENNIANVEPNISKLTRTNSEESKERRSKKSNEL